ncbi:helix-turn-helix domain-containing protein [Streptomyces catenulae]|uniref:Helix-turn-helix transcriptional regulator n=1 Tax=Streptomyces catenulae TaxID=66875 RepID=A0ABV2YS18_9ACTN|nr:helix-turn-helix transcriptional regulator [Streptomyces catenulae]
MSEFEAIDSLLASLVPEAELPDAAARRTLREQAGLSKAQVARALGVSPSTVTGWESGRDPAGQTRAKYAYLLDGLTAKLTPEADAPPVPEAEAAPAPEADGPGAPEQAAPARRDEPAVGTTPAPTGGGHGEARTEGPEDAGRVIQPEDAERAEQPTGVGRVERTEDAAHAEHPDGVSQDSNDGTGDEVESLAVPESCVLCGRPAVHRVAGFPQHLSAADCQGTAGPPAATPNPQPAAAAAPAPAPAPAPKADAPRRAPAARRPSAQSGKPAARRGFRAPSEPSDAIGKAVQAALADHHGDTEAATAALVRRAIPDAMALLDETRKGARYDIIAHPWMPDILQKQSSRGPDHIWEARPKWTRGELPPGEHQVTALDINGAYLSALKTHLPIGQLEHSTGFSHDRRRAGVHLITPPHWDHEHTLPNPLGQRDEPGPLWVTEPTLRLLQRLSGPRYGLCEPPEIHESYTSGATENLLEKFRTVLKDARDGALAAEDTVTLEYVKAMYAKFVSTMGESNYNRQLYRPDWMHLIRSQAFANLWMKALKAHEEGLTVVRAMGTDELHLIGDWRRVFPEGRAVTEVKVKDVYTAGTPVEAAGDAGEGE